MNRTAVTVIFLLLLGVGALVVAQDVDPVIVYAGYLGDVITYPDPDPNEVESMVVSEGNLETVTGDSAPWYGQVVTLEGEIGDFISTRMFTLGEGAALDNDQVLVVNNSVRMFPPEVMEHARIRVTGRIHPSLEAVNQGTPPHFGDLFGRDANATGTMPDSTTDTTATFQGDFTMLNSSLSSYGYVVIENPVSNLQELDRNLESLTDEQRTQLADALEQDAVVNETTYPVLSQALRDAASALRANDIASARFGLQAAVEVINNQAMTMPAIDPTAAGDAATAPMAIPEMVEPMPATTMMDFSRPNMVEWAYQGLIPNDLNNFTILEVFSVENVDFVEFAPNVVNASG